MTLLKDAGKDLLFRELRQLYKNSDIWRSLLDYSGVNSVDEIANYVLKNDFTTTWEVKQASSKRVIALFERRIKESFEDYLQHMGWTKQNGGWLGIDNDLKTIIDSYLNTFNSGGVVRYAKSILKWLNDPKYEKWEWKDWYITGDEIHQRGGFQDDMLFDRLGVQKLEGVKAIWKTQSDR